MSSVLLFNKDGFLALTKKRLRYNANVTTESDTAGKNYIGLTEGTFKQRYTQHKLSFRKETIQTARNYRNISGHSKTTTPILQLTGVL